MAGEQKKPLANLERIVPQSRTADISRANQIEQNKMTGRLCALKTGDTVRFFVPGLEVNTFKGNGYVTELTTFYIAIFLNGEVLKFDPSTGVSLQRGSAAVGWIVPIETNHSSDEYESYISGSEG